MMVDAPDPADARPTNPVKPGLFSVLDHCHRQTLAALDRLDDVIAGVEAGILTARTREIAADIVRHFSVTVRQHHEDEERHVFPALSSSSSPDVIQAVATLIQDHAWLNEDWMEICPYIDAAASGRFGYDPALLREGAATFAALSRDHIALEESLVYPESRARLSAGVTFQPGREMAARRRAERRRDREDVGWSVP